MSNQSNYTSRVYANKKYSIEEKYNDCITYLNTFPNASHFYFQPELLEVYKMYREIIRILLLWNPVNLANNMP